MGPRAEEAVDVARTRYGKAECEPVDDAGRGVVGRPEGAGHAAHAIEVAIAEVEAQVRGASSSIPVAHHEQSVAGRRVDLAYHHEAGSRVAADGAGVRGP